MWSSWRVVHSPHLSLCPSQTSPRWKLVYRSDITTSSQSLWLTWPKSLTTAAITIPTTRRSFSAQRCSKPSLYKSWKVSKRAGELRRSSSSPCFSLRSLMMGTLWLLSVPHLFSLFLQFIPPACVVSSVSCRITLKPTWLPPLCRVYCVSSCIFVCCSSLLHAFWFTPSHFLLSCRLSDS